jgi:hypothetical protein
MAKADSVHSTQRLTAPENQYRRRDAVIEYLVIASILIATTVATATIAMLVLG